MTPQTTEQLTPGSDNPAEIQALTSVIQSLQPLSPDVRLRVITAASAFLGLPTAVGNRPGNPTAPGSAVPRFSDDRTPSPKAFMFEKKPQTDVDRIACLAYYLTHYRSQPHFKTLDLSTLNTEAAQLKFSNPAYSTDNAAKAGILVPAIKGAKQLSSLGELYVQALPDRTAAKAVLDKVRARKSARRSKPVARSEDDAPGE